MIKERKGKRRTKNKITIVEKPGCLNEKFAYCSIGKEILNLFVLSEEMTHLCEVMTHLCEQMKG